MQQRIKKVIGREELVDFPNLGLFDIPAKVDTGAFTSAIHCHDIQELILDGKSFVSFYLVDNLSNEKKRFVTQVKDKKLIKNSFGDAQERFSITTFIRLFGQDFEMEVTLADRSNLHYPILLGRKLLHKRFVVDVSKRNQSYKSKQREKKKKV